MRKSQIKKKKGRESSDEVRIDKWLWAARFYKTRSIAKAMIEGGKVHYNGERVKTSKIVEVGALIKMRLGSDEKTVEVIEISDERRCYEIAKNLYQETPESIEKRETMAIARKANALSMPNPQRRPNKKERRDLIDFKVKRMNVNN